MTTDPADWNPNGGLIGWQYEGDQSGSYWNEEVSGYEHMCGKNGANCDDIHGLTDLEMKTKVSFEGWDFDEVWAIDAGKNDGCPYLQWQTSFTQTDLETPVITLLGFSEVEVTVGDEYVDEGATAEDGEDGNLADEIEIKSTVAQR